MTHGAAEATEARHGRPPCGIASTDGLGVIGPRRYMTILADPPWAQTMSGKYKTGKKRRPARLPYGTMTLAEIKALPVGAWADEGAHLWLWTTNEYLRAGFDVMEAWGFKYLAPVHWVKPSGIGNWFVHRTQTLLFGYKERCRFPQARYAPNLIETGDPIEHSAKPDATYAYIERISPGPRLEVFARPWTPMFPKRTGWDVWGNEVVCDVDLMTPNGQSSAEPKASAGTKCLGPLVPKRCEPCRATGAVHCADPENCGGPWDKMHDQPVAAEPAHDEQERRPPGAGRLHGPRVD